MGIIDAATKLTPTCKYGHGNLILITDGGANSSWALFATSGRPRLFSMNVFTCKVCGYIEMFDDDLLATTNQEGV